MPNYRRSQVRGGTWFFTLNLYDRNSSLLIEHFDELVDALKSTKRHYPFKLDALTVLPEHLHMVLTLATHDNDFSQRISMIKSLFSRQIPCRNNAKNLSRIKRGERLIWQRRFWEHQIRDQDDYNKHIEYCYINPVKHGHAKQVKDWKYSTFHRDVERGLFDIDWASELGIESGFGER